MMDQHTETDTTETAGTDTEGAGTGSMWDTLAPPADVNDAGDDGSEEQQYEDPAVTAAAQAAEDVPEWLGTRWRDLPEEQMGQVWAWLRGWVDWLVEAHRIPVDEIPPCWYRHPDIVEELWGAANAEAQAWEATTPTMIPMTAWHFHLRMMRDRLTGKAKQCVANKKHTPARVNRDGLGPAVLAVDEADWAAHLAEIRDLQPVALAPGQAPAKWRMCAVDEAGEVLVSEAVDVAPAARLAPVTITAAVRRGTDTLGDVLLGATVDAGAGGVSATWWESSSDGGTTWEKVITSEADRTPGDTTNDNLDEGERS